MAGALSVSNGNHGASTSFYWDQGWPYNSGSNVWDKFVLKISGGATCCNAYSNLYISDNITSYTALWVNTKANTSVYVLPSRSSSVNTRFYINNVINPNPVSYLTYQKGLTV